jgi:histidyl-tRNA synthetase
LEELQLVHKTRTPAPVFLPFFDPQRLHDYLRLAAAIRRQGVGVEFYPEPKKLPQQLKYADRRGFALAIIAGANEWAAGTCQIKDLATGLSTSVALADVPSVVAARLREKSS